MKLKKLIKKISRIFIILKIKERIDMIRGLQIKKENPPKIEAPLHSNLQVRETHYNKTIKTERLNNFKIASQRLVK